MKKRYLLIVIPVVIALIALGVVLRSFATAPSASARSSQWVLTPLPPGTVLTYPAGSLCPFNEQATFTFDKEYTKVLTATKAGVTLEQLTTGPLKVTMTNLDNGKSVDINASGPGKTTTYADGTQTIDATGHGVVLLTPAMQQEVGLPGNFLIKGHYLETFYTDGTVSFTYTGSYTDICAELS